MKRHWTTKLKRMGACNEAVEWSKAYPTIEAAWAACKRGDWMLWYAGAISGPPGSESRRKLSACCAAIAETVLDKYETKHPDDKRPRAAIEAAKIGDPDVCRSASEAAWAAWAAAAWAAWAAAASASEAAWAASASASASAWASAWAAWAAAAAAERSKAKAQHADIVRRHYPTASSCKPKKEA